MNEYGESNSNSGKLHVYNSIPRYSERESEALAERLVNKETFREAQQVLITWLEDGQCTERNSAQFYSLIQLCRNHMEKLQTKKKEYYEEAQKVQESLENKSCCIQLQLNELEDVFKALEKENTWSNFTQNQIEKIHEMRKDIIDLKQNILNGSVGIVVEEEESSMENE
ncbi:hypothetical protein AVEN_12461-1 [Araneus ventricosus]|uniref:Uncharacterized protein n=1 Tax=Araneus ventricosus TaxID=182803 RepID=A0A4Y2AIL6_ARAVE|nr:hypothetical protein AVEN_12461-1 [Araneus ventricosus]